MGKKVEYKLGDIVIAKCRREHPWPAQISKVQSQNVYKVTFYGENNWAFVSGKHLKPFTTDNIQKLTQIGVDRLNRAICKATKAKEEKEQAKQKTKERDNKIEKEKIGPVSSQLGQSKAILNSQQEQVPKIKEEEQDELESQRLLLKIPKHTKDTQQEPKDTHKETDGTNWPKQTMEKPHEHMQQKSIPTIDKAGDETKRQEKLQENQDILSNLVGEKFKYETITNLQILLETLEQSLIEGEDVSREYQWVLTLLDMGIISHKDYFSTGLAQRMMILCRLLKESENQEAKQIYQSIRDKLNILKSKTVNGPMWINDEVTRFPYHETVERLKRFGEPN